MLGLASCQTEPEGLGVNVGGEVDTVVTVTIPETETRYGNESNSALGVFDNGILKDANTTMRYILEIYYGDIMAERQVQFSDEQKTIAFPVRLVPNRHYNFVVWADVVTKDAGDEQFSDRDYHYNTTSKRNADGVAYGLDNVSLKDTWVAMDESRDAFTGYHNTEEKGTKYTGTIPINITLTRPFAKLRVITTDMVELGNLNITPVSAKVTYSEFSYESFNALEGTYSGEISSKTHTYAIADYADFANTANKNSHKVLFTDYFFAADNDIVKFELDVYEGDVNNQTPTTLIKHNDFKTDIPAKRNYLTTIQGHILTEGNNIEVTVNGAFENVDNGNTTDPDYDYTTISSEKEFMDAIDKGGNYILISDINITGVSATSLATTRATGTTTTINLNGYTITLNANIEVPAGKTLIINDEPNDEGNEEGAIINDGGAIVNKGTLNIEGGAFGANTIKNEDNGVVNITGGTFKSNPSDFVDDDYAVVENNGEFTLELKNETVEVNDTKYRSLKKAFDAAQNGDTVKFIADVTQKDGVLITDKNLTIDLNGKTFTITDGANTNNRNFKVNGTSVVTIKKGTLVAEGELTSGAYGTVRTEDTAVANLEDLKLYSYRGYGLNVKANTGTTINIKDSEIYAQYSGGVEAAGGNIELTNVKIDPKGVYSSAAWCSVAIGVNSGGKVTVNSGDYSASAISTDTNAAQGTWVAYVMSSGGTLDIKGGTFNGVVAETAAAANACGIICADRAAVVNIEGGNFNSNGAILDMRNNVGTQPNPKATLYGGTFSADPRISGLYASNLITIADGCVVVENDGKYSVVKPAAMVGTTIYNTIDEAIAAWTHNTTLTLMSDVTLTDVITLKSTEYHVLDLGTFTMTAASKKDAISITAEGRTSASYALDIKADATNPGGITATSKAVVKTTGKSGVQDRPIIRFYNGVFNAGNIVSHSGSNGTKCPQFWFYGGVYNGNMSANRALFQFYGGTFNGKFYISVDSSAYALISGGKFKYLDNLYGSALTSDKFTIGSSKGNFDRGIYVDDEGYFVVVGAVITEFGDMFAAKATNASKAGSYLPYSSAAEYGLYYTNAAAAIAKHGEANVELKKEQQ